MQEEQIWKETGKLLDSNNIQELRAAIVDEGNTYETLSRCAALDRYVELEELNALEILNQTLENSNYPEELRVVAIQQKKYLELILEKSAQELQPTIKTRGTVKTNASIRMRAGVQIGQDSMRSISTNDPSERIRWNAALSD